ncbi:hypothetical protein [Metapseudomonas otitidis]|uniref:hypothetical protein n=1 Tax=Metapseudomonas otitidis TaxID=319939 RepID=UPI002811AC7D|nr:hypothetical protein [Pseudomonas otitidis]WMR30991.1 hypothetical protein QT513_17485 [Pseudomonas otitidis]
MERAVFITCGAILIALLSLSLGAAIGASSTPQDFKDIMIPLLSMVGGWVSGIGTLAAVVVSLYLAKKQKESDSEDISVTSHTAISPAWNGHRVLIAIVSKGNRPANIHSINIVKPKAETVLYIAQFDRVSSTLPATISYGEKRTYVCLSHFEDEIAKYVNDYCEGIASGLLIYVSSTLKTFKEPLNAEIIKVIQQRADAFRAANAQAANPPTDSHTPAT